MRLSPRLLVAAAVVASGAAAAWVLTRSGAPDSPQPAVTDGADAGLEPWCADGLRPVVGGGCYAPPTNASARTTLLVYAHGRYSPKTLDEEHTRQARVAKLANARGFGVLAVHGVQGECTQKELADTWCWPSNPRNADDGPAFVRRMQTAIAAARLELGPGPDVLLGFSNGAYFATLIATRALTHFDAIAIAHGGPVPPTHASGERPPLLLVTADDDPSDGEMRELDAELAREKWPHELVSREGGHELPETDVRFALTFFERALREPLPLSPPLQAPRPRRDAAPPEPSEASADDDETLVASTGSDAQASTARAADTNPYEQGDDGGS